MRRRGTLVSFRGRLCGLSHTVVSLDDVPPAPLAKPFALAFASNEGAVVAGTLSDIQVKSS